MGKVFFFIVIMLWIFAGLSNLTKKAKEAQKRVQQRPKKDDFPEVSQTQQQQPRPVRRDISQTTPSRPQQRPAPKRPSGAPTPTTKTEPPKELQELIDLLMPQRKRERVAKQRPKPAPIPVQKPKSAYQPVRKAPEPKVVSAPVTQTPKPSLQFSDDPVVNGIIFAEIFSKPVSQRKGEKQRAF